MCLTINNLTRDVAEELVKNYVTAKRDMKVYKVLRQTTKAFKSPYQGFSWQKGQHYYQTDGKLGTTIQRSYLSTYPDFVSINVHQGLHAYTTLNEAVKSANWMDFHKRLRIIEMIVPKGAKYLIDKRNHEIVATEMIFHDDAKVENFLDFLTTKK